MLAWIVDTQIGGATSTGRNHHRQTVSGTIHRSRPDDCAPIPPSAIFSFLPKFSFTLLKERIDLRSHSENHYGHYILQCCLLKVLFLAFFGLLNLDPELHWSCGSLQKKITS